MWLLFALFVLTSIIEQFGGIKWDHFEENSKWPILCYAHYLDACVCVRIQVDIYINVDIVEFA